MNIEDDGYFNYYPQNVPLCIQNWNDTKMTSTDNTNNNNVTINSSRSSVGNRHMLHCDFRVFKRDLLLNNSKTNTKINKQHKYTTVKHKLLTDDYIHPSGISTFEMISYILCTKMKSYLCTVCAKIEALFNTYSSDNEDVKHCVREIVELVFSYNGKINNVTLQKIIKQKHHSEHIDSILHKNCQVISHILQNALDSILDHVNV